MPLSKPLRVCYFGTYRAEYSRNRIMIQGLRRNGFTVIECHEQLWNSIDERVNAVQGGWMKPRFWMHLLRTYARLLRRYWQISSDYDVMVVGYPGQFDLFLARILTWWQRKPLVWDIFMSIYLIAMERGLGQSHLLTVNLIRFLEKCACWLPDMLILDTQEYVNWFEKTHGIPMGRFRLVPTGADSDRFTALSPQAVQIKDFSVLYYGTFIPNHGVNIIIEAAKLLKDKTGIRFILIGDGPDRQQAMHLCGEYAIQNVEFYDWMEQQELIHMVSKATICLGAFGDTPQSLMTIQNKIYECLAMGKAVISGKSVTAENTFQHDKHLYLCERSAESLAQAITTLYSNRDKLNSLAKEGHQLFLSQFTIERLGLLLGNHLEKLVG